MGPLLRIPAFLDARIRRWISVAGVLMGTLTLAIIQDLLQSQRNSYSFYLSESMLFNTVWLLFGPVAYVQLHLFEGVRWLSGRLSGHYRTVAFVVSSSVVHLVAFSVLVYGLSVVFFNHTYTPVGNFTYSLSQDLYKYLLVYGAIALVGLSRPPTKSTPLPTNPDSPLATGLDRITVMSGRTTVVVPTHEIILIRSDAPYLRVLTADKTYLHTQTLKAISRQLDKHRFVRIHKSTIVNVQRVVSFRSRLNGDYDVLLDNQTEVRLSRHYVPAFRQYYTGDSSF
jgi:hypothetical protein